MMEDFVKYLVVSCLLISIVSATIVSILFFIKITKELIKDIFY